MQEAGALAPSCWACEMVRPLWTTWWFLKKMKKRLTQSRDATSGYRSKRTEAGLRRMFVHPRTWQQHSPCGAEGSPLSTQVKGGQNVLRTTEQCSALNRKEGSSDAGDDMHEP